MNEGDMPAFPRLEKISPNDGYAYSSNGMTLRDYAEIQFIAASLSHGYVNAVEFGMKKANEWLKARTQKESQ